MSAADRLSPTTDLLLLLYDSERGSSGLQPPALADNGSPKREGKVKEGTCQISTSQAGRQNVATALEQKTQAQELRLSPGVPLNISGHPLPSRRPQRMNQT